MEEGWGLDVTIVFYRNGYFVVVEDAALSVRGHGTPNATAWGGGAVGSKQAQKKIRL